MERRARWWGDATALRLGQRGFMDSGEAQPIRGGESIFRVVPAVLVAARTSEAWRERGTGGSRFERSGPTTSHRVSQGLSETLHRGSAVAGRLGGREI